MALDLAVPLVALPLPPLAIKKQLPQLQLQSHGHSMDLQVQLSDGINMVMAHGTKVTPMITPLHQLQFHHQHQLHLPHPLTLTESLAILKMQPETPHLAVLQTGIRMLLLSGQLVTSMELPDKPWTRETTLSDAQRTIRSWLNFSTLPWRTSAVETQLCSCARWMSPGHCSETACTVAHRSTTPSRRLKISTPDSKRDPTPHRSKRTTTVARRTSSINTQDSSAESGTMVSSSTQECSWPRPSPHSMATPITLDLSQHSHEYGLDTILTSFSIFHENSFNKVMWLSTSIYYD